VGELIDWFGSSYGWGINQVLDLTLEEVNLLTNAASKRLKAMYGDGKKGAKIKGKPKKIEDMFDKFQKYNQLEEVD